MGVLRVVIPRPLRKDEKLKVTVNDMCMFAAIKEGSILEGFVQEGDIVTSVNGEECKNLAQFVPLSKKYGPRGLVLTLRRENLRYEPQKKEKSDDIDYVSVLFPPQGSKKGLCVSDKLVITEVREDSVFEGKLRVGDRIQAAYSPMQNAFVRLHLKDHLRVFVEMLDREPLQLKVCRKPRENKDEVDVNEWKAWGTVQPNKDHYAVFYRVKDIKEFKKSVEFSLKDDKLNVKPKSDANGLWKNCFSDKDILTHVNGKEAKDLKAVKKSVDSTSEDTKMSRILRKRRDISLFVQRPK